MRLPPVLLAAAAAFAQPQDLRITHGPMLGHVTATGIHIWARTSRPGEFRVRYGLTPERLDRVSQPALTTLERDNTGWIRLEGLDPDTRYYYQPVTARDAGAAGSFRTLPAPEQFRHPETNPRGLFNFRFQFGSCADQRPRNTPGPDLPAYRTMLSHLRDKASFSIMNGDWLYEDKREFTVEQWRAQNGVAAGQVPRILQIAPSLTGVWENYKFFLERGVPLAAWHREMPSYYTPDDHEILNDVYGTATVGLRNRRTVFRDIGMQAWYDYLAGSHPVAFSQAIRFGEARLEAGSDILTDPAADFGSLDLAQVNNLHVHWGGQYAGVDTAQGDRAEGNPNAGVYEIVGILDRNRLRIRPAARSSALSPYSIGRHSFVHFRVGNADFFLLDTRSHRDSHDVKDPFRKGSIIGARQREWLKERMANSDADFFFLASSVNVMIPHVGTPGSTAPDNKDDAWTAFAAEREEMIRFWDSLGKPVMIMTGDLHNSFAVRITDRVWEFGSGPLNSQNHPAKSEGGRPANGAFDSRGRKVDIRWSTYVRDDVPATLRRMPYYAVAQINNVYDNPVEPGRHRWVAYPRPHVVVQYYDGRTGDLLYAEAVHGREAR